MKTRSEYFQAFLAHGSEARIQLAVWRDSLNTGDGDTGFSMVITWQNSERTRASILARGNFSLDAGGLANLLLALALVSLCLAGLLALQGYWPILVIALIQLALVAWIMIVAWRKAWVSEVIDISAESIVVTHQRHRKKRQMELGTAWAVIELRQPEVAWYAPRVYLRSGPEEVELGSFLTTEEKHQLVQHLQGAIEKHSALKSV
jgi:uncharacterized membrane protein